MHFCQGGPLLAAVLACQTLMFLISGLFKLFSPAKDRGRLEKRLADVGLPVPAWASLAGILAAGALEVGCSLLVVCGAFSDSKAWKVAGRNAALALSAFTVLVTIVFYPPVSRWYPFSSNVSTLAGLVLTACLLHKE